MSTSNRTHSVPNPASGTMRPVELITDRAKRYRANRNPPEGPRRCGFCWASNPRDIDHIDGDEGNGAPNNLQYLCRSCNTKKGITQARAKVGKRTRQRNPAPVKPLRYAEYLRAVEVLRGDRPGDVSTAAARLQATNSQQRQAYAARRAERNPAPTFGQYARAVSIHQRGAHDEGGAIIHETPASLRSQYAREIARRKRASQVPF